MTAIFETAWCADIKTIWWHLNWWRHKWYREHDHPAPMYGIMVGKGLIHLKQASSLSRVKGPYNFWYFKYHEVAPRNGLCALIEYFFLKLCFAFLVSKKINRLLTLLDVGPISSLWSSTFISSPNPLWRCIGPNAYSRTWWHVNDLHSAQCFCSHLRFAWLYKR